MPRHKDTKEFKGFAFVEFDSAAAAARAVRELNEWTPKAPGTLLQSTAMAVAAACIQCADRARECAASLRVIPHAGWQELKRRYKQLQRTMSAGPRVGPIGALLPAGAARADSAGPVLATGVLVRLRNIGPGVNRTMIRELAEMSAPVAYVDHSPEDAADQAVLRFTTAEGAAAGA